MTSLVQVRVILEKNIGDVNEGNGYDLNLLWNLLPIHFFSLIPLNISFNLFVLHIKHIEEIQKFLYSNCSLICRIIAQPWNS